MDSAASEELDGVVSRLQFDVISKYCTVAASALLVWHHFLTLDKEVSLFWRRRPNAACALFLANRYICLVYSVYNLFWESYGASYSGANAGCAAGSITQWSVYSFQYIILAAFSGLRVYALGRRWVWATLVLLLSLAPVVAYIATLGYEDFAAVPSFGCSGSPMDAASLQICQRYLSVIPPTISGANATLTVASVFTIARIALILADLIVVTVTWAATRRYGSPEFETRRLFGRVTMLSSVLYKHGTIYFVVLTAINVLYLIFNAFSLADADAPAIVAFFEVLMYGAFSSITAILITRFLADLQVAASASVRLGGSAQSESTDDSESLGVLRFVRADVDNWIEDALRSVPTVDCEGAGGSQWSEERGETLASVRHPAD